MRPNNYFSTLSAMAFIVCLPLGFMVLFIVLLFNEFLGQTPTYLLAYFASFLIFIGGVFFILHFIFRLIEKDGLLDYNNDRADEILDEDMIQ